MERFAACLGLSPEPEPSVTSRDVTRMGKFSVRASSASLPPTATKLPSSGCEVQHSATKSPSSGIWTNCQSNLFMDVTLPHIMRGGEGSALHPPTATKLTSPHQRWWGWFTRTRKERITQGYLPARAAK
eukprot:1158629-Pelagomonas_calceolata.AAC.2